MAVARQAHRAGGRGGDHHRIVPCGGGLGRSGRVDGDLIRQRRLPPDRVRVVLLRDGEATLAGAKRSSRIHPRCGTNILIYIILASLIAPVVSWPPYAVLQFVLISEAWYLFGNTRPSIAAGNFLQRFFTTSEPRRAELEVAVESLQRLVQAESGELQAEIGKTFQIPARF